MSKLSRVLVIGSYTFLDSNYSFVLLMWTIRPVSDDLFLRS